MATVPRKTAPKPAPKPAAKPAAKPDVAKNTSAPTSEIPAEVLAKEAEQSASTATLQPVVDDTTRTQKTSISPAGGKAKNVVKSLVISSKVEGFRRAGRPWSRMAESVSVDDFTNEQIEALLAEPMLDVVVIPE